MPNRVCSATFQVWHAMWMNVSMAKWATDLTRITRWVNDRRRDRQFPFLSEAQVREHLNHLCRQPSTGADPIVRAQAVADMFRLTDRGHDTAQALFNGNGQLGLDPYDVAFDASLPAVVVKRLMTLLGLGFDEAVALTPYDPQWARRHMGTVLPGSAKPASKVSDQMARLIEFMHEAYGFDTTVGYDVLRDALVSKGIAGLANDPNQYPAKALQNAQKAACEAIRRARRCGYVQDTYDADNVRVVALIRNTETEGVIGNAAAAPSISFTAPVATTTLPAAALYPAPTTDSVFVAGADKIERNRISPLRYRVLLAVHDVTQNQGMPANAGNVATVLDQHKCHMCASEIKEHLAALTALGLVEQSGRGLAPTPKGAGIAKRLAVGELGILDRFRSTNTLIRRIVAFLLDGDPLATVETIARDSGLSPKCVEDQLRLLNRADVPRYDAQARQAPLPLPPDSEIPLGAAEPCRLEPTPPAPAATGLSVEGVADTASEVLDECCGTVIAKWVRDAIVQEFRRRLEAKAAA